MLSLLSDEYRGKTQGLRIGANIVESTDIKTSTIQPSTGTNLLSIQDQKQRDFITVDGSQDEVNFPFAGKFESGLKTNSIYAETGGSGEIQSFGKSLNLLNTYQFYEYRSIPDIGAPFGTFAAATPLPASSLPTPTLEKSNFQFPFTTNNGGWLSGVAFDQNPVYQVTFSITGNNSNHPAVIALASYDVVTNTKKDYIARGIMDSGIGRSASVTGTWVYESTFPTIGFVIYSPQGGTAISASEINVTFTRLF